MPLIEKNGLYKQIYEVYDYEFPTASGGFDEFVTKIIPNIINNQKEIDAAPIVHAQWLELVPGDGSPYCSNCKRTALGRGLFLNPKLMDWYITSYCPHCGAKMDLN